MVKRKEDEFIPLPKAYTDKIRFDVNLPRYVNSDEIGINLQRLKTLCFLGGIEHLKIVSQNGEECQHDAPQIAGFTSSGEAYASTSQTAPKPPISTTDLNVLGGKFMLLQDRWVNGVIKIDTTAAADSINADHSRKKGTRDPQAWAQIIDTSLKKGVTEIGTRHLLGSDNIYDMVPLLAHALGSLPAAGMSSLNLEVFFTKFIFIMPFSILIIHSLLQLSPLTRSTTGFRPSLFYGIQPEYVLAQKFLSRKTLAKKI